MHTATKILAAAAIALCVLAFFQTGRNLCREIRNSKCDDCCKPDKPVQPPRRDALELHRWYYPTKAVGWSWERREWGPTYRAGGMQLNPETPLYCTQRLGNVAVLQGGLHGEVIVPDGPSTRWFRQIRGENGENSELGELPEPNAADP